MGLDDDDGNGDDEGNNDDDIPGSFRSVFPPPRDLLLLERVVVLVDILL